MPKEPAWSLPLKTTERTRDVAFIQRIIRSTLSLYVKKKYIEIFFIYNVRAYGPNACPNRLILRNVQKKIQRSVHISQLSMVLKKGCV